MFNCMLLIAKRFIVEMPILAQIERDCLEDLELIKKAICIFFKDYPKLDDMIDFVDALYETGQKIQDYNINLLSMAEIDDDLLPKNGKELSFEERNNLIVLSMMRKLQKMDMLHKKYEAEFHDSDGSLIISAARNYENYINDRHLNNKFLTKKC